jgi:hypothetical protein
MATSESVTSSIAFELVPLCGPEQDGGASSSWDTARFHRKFIDVENVDGQCEATQIVIRAVCMRRDRMGAAGIR